MNKSKEHILAKNPSGTYSEHNTILNRIHCDSKMKMTHLLAAPCSDRTPAPTVLTPTVKCPISDRMPAWTVFTRTVI